MLTLHHMQLSGNCYKVRLAGRQLGIPLALKDYPFGAGQTRKPEFLGKNPNGRVPALEFDDGKVLPESGAILFYLADGSRLFPADRLARAQALQWMFFEQYEHEPYIAVARRWMKFETKEALAAKQHLVPEWHAKGNAALGVMQSHLANHDWFAGGQYSIADIALYGYTHVAEDGGFDLARYPGILSWLRRVAAEPNHITIDESW